MKHLLLILSILISGFGYSQCITASYGVFPTAAFTNSSCNGTNQNITTNGWAGEYSVVNVTAGNTYVFSSSIATDFITIATTVPAAIVWGTTPVSWTATFTGQVRFYNHTNSSCGEQNSSRTRRVSCSAPAPVNNLCANATNLPCGTTNLAGTTNGTTNIAHTTGCGISNFGVWYTFVGNGQTTTISSTAAGFNHEMVVLQGPSCGALTTVACVDVTSSTTGTESYPFSTVNGSTYYVYIGHTTSGGATTGNFTISRTCNPPTTADCSGATQICNDQSFAGNSGGFGTVQDLSNLNGGCLAGNEHQSSWYYWVPTVNGTIEMTIQTSVDYDFAIWQGTNCSNLGLPAKCSFAATPGNTGMRATNHTPFFNDGFWGYNANSEGQFGNGWLSPLNVTAGTFYIMVIDNFTADNTPFTIDFTFSTPNLLNCTPIPLPIDLLSFTGENIDNENIINWVTSSEINNDYFKIEHSFDTENWKLLSIIKGNNSPSMYEYIHENPRNVNNYYKLTQVDFDGKEYDKGTIVINNIKEDVKIVGIYNILGQIVTMEYIGLKIIQYSDGSTNKIY